MSDGPSLLEVQNLNAGYGHSQVLFDLTMLARSRGAVAILGRNGAGKSTLLKTIAGEIRPMSGVIWFDQRHAADEASERRVTGELLRPIRSHCTLVIVEHDIDFVKSLCDCLTVLDQGRVLDEGSVEQIERSRKVQEVYTSRV